MCVSIDKSASLLAPNINATSLSVKSFIEKEKENRRRRRRRRKPNFENKNHILRHLNILDS
jgi:hypothetical protein